jgi:hypothetical protein
VQLYDLAQMAQDICLTASIPLLHCITTIWPPCMRSAKTNAPITAMHIHNGTLSAEGDFGVNLHPSDAILNAESGLAMYIPIDASGKNVYGDIVVSGV